MAVDKGGLRYPIEVPDQFSPNMGKFLDLLKQIRAEVAGLKKEASAGAELKGLRTELSGSRREAERLSREVKKVQQETGLTGRALKEEVAARKKLRDEQRRIRIEVRKARLESEESFKTAKTVLDATQQRTAAERNVTRAVNRRATAEKELEVIKQRGTQLDQRAAQRRAASTARELEAIKAKQRLQDATSRSADAEIRQLTAKEEVLKRIARAERELAVRQSLAGQGRDARGNIIPAAPPPPAAPRRNRQQELRDFVRLDDVLRSTETRANRLSFTFRRLFGIFAAFAAVRTAVRTFNEIVAASIRFNAQIEQANLGIAALFTAVGEVRDPFGQTVDSARALNIAQSQAREQTFKLRQEALKTTATFQQLLDTFQIAIAPGLTAGLDLDEIRRFTVSISQAAAAIGLPQNQLAEEIRSVLSGTIQSRTTRIAVSLGITNDDIRRAKEAGTLAEFLEERFAAFNEAGKQSFQTFNGLVNRLRDGFEILFQSAAVPFFEEVKDLLRDIFDLVTETDIGGAVTPSPQAVAIVDAISDGLRAAVEAARGIRESLTFEEALRSAARLGAIIGGAARILSSAAVGFLRGISDIEIVLRKVGDLIEDLVGDLDGVRTRDLVADFVRIATVLVGIQLTVGVISSVLGLVTSTVGLLVGPLVTIVSLLRAAFAFTSGIAAIIGGGTIAIVLAIAVAVGAIVFGAKQLLDYVAGTELKLSTIVRLVKNSLQGALLSSQAIVLDVFAAVTRFASRFDSIILFPLRTAAQGVLTLLNGIRELNKIFGISTGAIDNASRSIERFVSGVERGLSTDYADAYAAAAQGLRAQIESLNLDSAEAILNNEDAPGIGQFLGKQITDGIRSVFRDGSLSDLLSLDSILEAAFDINRAFESLSISVGRPLTTLESLSEISGRIRDDLRDSIDALNSVRAIRGLEGPAAGIVESTLSAAVRVREESKQIDQDIEDTSRNLLRLSTQRDEIEGRILQKRQLEQQFIDQVESGFRRQIERLNQISGAETEIALQRARLARAREDDRGPDGDIAASALATAEETARQLREAFEGEARALEGIQAQIEQQGISAREIVTLAQARIRLGGEQVAAEERLLILGEERAKLEGRVNAIIANRIAAQAASATERAANENFSNAVDLLRQQVEFSTRNADILTRRLAESQNEVFIARQIRDAEEARGATQIASLFVATRQAQARLAEAQALAQAAQTEEDRLSAQQQVQAQQAAISSLTALTAQTQNQVTLAVQETNFALELAEETAGKIRAQVEAPLSTGFLEGLRIYADQYLSVFDSISGLVASSLEQITAEGASLIADLFDPTANVDLRERAGRLLLSLGQQVLQTLLNTILAQFVTQVLTSVGILQTQAATQSAAASAWAAVGVQWAAIAATLQSAATILAVAGFGVGFNKGGPIGRAEGGSIPNRPVPVSAKPAGLHPTDRIPIWAAKDEFMVRASSAMRYGHDVLQKINQGLIDPQALRALAGYSSSRRKSVARAPKLGYAAGGSIAGGSTRSSSPEFVGSQVGRQQPTPAYLVANEQMAEMLLNAGAPAFRRFLDENGYRRS
jgi:hypothetical protein